MNPNTVLVSTIDRYSFLTLAIILLIVTRWYPVDDVYRSTNGGASWISLSATAQMNVSEFPYLTFGGSSAKFGWWMGMVQVDPFNSNR